MIPVLVRPEASIGPRCAGCGLLEDNSCGIRSRWIGDQVWCQPCLVEARRGAVMAPDDLRGPGRPMLVRP